VKKFKFSLERVRRVRKIQETLRLTEHKRAERALKSQEEKLGMFTTERDAQRFSMELAVKQEFRIADRQTGLEVPAAYRAYRRVPARRREGIQAA
jgi:hypothetical protein